MTPGVVRVPSKWRPSLRLIAGGLIAAVFFLPFVSLIFLRLYENLLLRQTEAELIGQTAVIAAAVAALGDELAPGPPAPPRATRYVIDHPDRYAPVEPGLDLATGQVLPPRPGAVPAPPLTGAEARLGAALTPILADTQRVTLAGFRVVNRDATVIAGGGEVGQSLRNVWEVQVALQGRFHATLRNRYSDEPPPPLTSLSRGTRVRIFAAMPIMRDGRVVGAVLASRTPQNVLRDLYGQRGRVALALGLTLLGAALVGYVFLRTVGRPILALRDQAARVARDPGTDLTPLPHYGSREVASLGASLGDMAASLRRQADGLRTYAQHVTHELKSPLTAIRGAAEVLQGDLSPADRDRFLARIEEQAGRMDRLLAGLRDLARAETTVARGACRLSEAARGLRAEPGLAVTVHGDAALALPASDLRAVLGHLAANARQAGAEALTIRAETEENTAHIVVTDDGPGVAPGDATRLFEPFFTTRAGEGGTGMGLGIARAMLRAQGGDLVLKPTSEPDGAEAGQGARFVLTVPLARDLHDQA